METLQWILIFVAYGFIMWLAKLGEELAKVVRDHDDLQH